MRLGINTLFMVPGDVGGTETYLRETLLAALQVAPEHEFVLFTNNENDELFRQLCAGRDNVSCVCLGFNAARRPVRILLEQLKLPFVVWKHKIDLLWSPGYTAPFVSPCRQVVTICDLQYKSFPEDMTRLERLTLDILVKGGCRCCDAVLAISEFSRGEIIRHGFAVPQKVHALLLGVDESFAPEKAPVGSAELLQERIPLDVPYILCVAHTYPHKKVDVLVEAFGLLLDEIPHNLVVVGKPRRGEEQLQAAVAGLKDSSRLFRFSEGLPYNVLQAMFRGADIFVLPSAYEGFGLPVVEGLMAGVPVITTKEASLPEVGGDSAFYMDDVSSDALARQIHKVLDMSPDERAQRIEAGRRWADTFTWEKSARKMFNVFRTLQQKQ